MDTHGDEDDQHSGLGLKWLISVEFFFEIS